MSLTEIWNAFQAAYLRVPNHSINDFPPRFDNPFLVTYAVYHYYRSLGWVVKGGIKFCVDYLLYKRGPVFHHAEYVYQGSGIQIGDHLYDVLGSELSFAPYIRIVEIGSHPPMPFRMLILSLGNG